jgi:AraC family transcriptional regulator
MNTTTCSSREISVPISTLSSLVSLLQEAARSITVAPDKAGEYLTKAAVLLYASGAGAPTREKRPLLKAELPALAPWQIRKIAVYVEQNLATKLERAQMADLAGLSIHHFSKSFKSSVGVSPCRYVLRKRVNLATQLMADPTKPLIDIALACGFADQSHFTRAFKRILRLSPGAWRRYHIDLLAAEKR